MKKTTAVLFLVLVLTFIFAITASASQPESLSGFFYFVPPYGGTDYCIATGEGYIPDGFMNGCVDQTDKPGLGEHGTIDITMAGYGTGTCEFNLRAYEIDGIARIVVNRCSGDLVGLHMQAVGWAWNGLWEGSYHFEP